jgi:S-DNA-T family DNA segregation ATPase FtsK/SpoIIIE
VTSNDIQAATVSLLVRIDTQGIRRIFYPGILIGGNFMRVEKKLFLALNKIAEGFRYIDSRAVQCGSEHAFRIPMGKSAHDVQSRIESLVSSVGAPVELIDRGGAVIVRVVEQDFKQRLKFRPTDLSDDKLIIGYDRLMRPHYHRAMHMLAGGAAGSGKTLWLKWILYQLANMSAEINIVDMKGFSYFPFESLPSVTVAKNLGDAADLLHRTCAELERREKLVIKHRDRSIIKQFPLYAAVVDEAAQVAPKMHTGRTKEYAKFCDECISRIAQKGRETKVILIYCTQRPSADIINGQVKSNVEAAVAFRTYTDYDSRIILNTEGAEKISVATPGRCIFRGSSFHTLQVPFIGEEDAEWETLLQPLKVEVLNHGSSHRTESPRQYIEGSFTSADCNDTPASNAERFSRPTKESVRHSEGTRTREVGARALSWAGKGMAASEVTDEIPD